MPRKKGGKSKRNGSHREQARGASSKRRITPADLLNFHGVSDPNISPDGASILFTKKHVGDKNKELANLWIVPTDGGEARQFSSGDKDGYGRFSPDGSRIAFISGRDESKPDIFTLSADGGEAVPLTSFPEGKIGSFRWSPDGAMLAVAFRETAPEWTAEAKKQREESGESTPPRIIDDLYYRLDGDGYFSERRFHLYLVDVATGAHRLLFDRDTTGSFSYDWSPDSSELVVAANTDPDALLKSWRFELYRIKAATGKLRKLPDVPLGRKSCVRWSPDGKWIAYSGREGKEIWGVHNSRLYVCRAEGGGVRELTEGTDYCLTAVAVSDSAEAVFEPNIAWSPDAKRVFMSIGWHGSMRVASVAVAGSDFQFHTPDKKCVSLGNFSGDGQQLALTVGDQLTIPEVAVGRLGKKAARLKVLTSFNTELLNGLELSPAESHWVKSASGTKVHVWVMKPPGFREGKKYPAILEIHGGPHAQYGETFFNEFQVLAAAGYVVVYSNPRGSKGYGEEHCAAIKGDWGNADWEDIQAVTKFMQQQPFIDAKRMGVMGGSYGGYMTNWVIGHCHDFAAAVTDRCVSNLVSMVGSSDVPLVPGEYWDGNSWDNTEQIWEQSPLKHFGNVQTPTLVIHSEGDLRCNVEQGEQVFAALKLQGVPVRFIRYPASTSHGMSRCGPADLRQHRLNAILRWWGEYLV